MNKQLRALIDRAERLIAEREEVAESIRDLRKEVKSGGWDAAQIMRLAQLSHDDKKRAKLAATNEMLALYNRESGLGLVLGLDEPEADAPTRKDGGEGSNADAASSASDTHSPAGRLPPDASPDPVPVAAVALPDAVPAGETCHHDYVRGVDGGLACVFCGEVVRFFSRPLAPAPREEPPSAAADTSGHSSGDDTVRRGLREVAQEIETDRADDDGVPEGGVGERTPAPPDPDAGWQAKDSAATYDGVRAIQRAELVASGNARLHPDEMPDIPPFLDRRNPACAAARGEGRS